MMFTNSNEKYKEIEQLVFCQPSKWYFCSIEQCFVYKQLQKYQKLRSKYFSSQAVLCIQTGLAASPPLPQAATHRGAHLSK